MPIPFNVSENLQRFATNHRQFVTHHTANATLTYRQTGSLHTNLGAGGAVVLTLPQNADKGVYFDFAVMTAQELTISPGAAGAIYINGGKQADDKTITADDEAECVRLTCTGSGDWVATNVIGTWTVQN